MNKLVKLSQDNNGKLKGGFAVLLSQELLNLKGGGNNCNCTVTNYGGSGCKSS